jgi:hypothetical protein
MQKTYVYLINSFRKPVNLGNSARIHLFCHTSTPGFFLHPFCLDIIFGVLCRCLQACQSLVFDGVIGVHRGFTTFFTYCPPQLRYCSGFASFICDSDFLTFIVFVGFPSFSKPTHTHLKYLIVVYPWLSYRGTQICAA